MKSSAPKPRIVVVGSSNTDMIVRTARIPRPGETVLGGEFRMASGGKGANQAVAAARAGGDVVLVARVGRDVFSGQSLAGFVRDGIGTEHVHIDSTTPSGIALIVVGRNGENCIAVASGANARLGAADVASARDEIRSAKALLLQLEIPLPAVRKAAAMARSAGALVILNPAPAQRLDDLLLANTDVLTPNESEAQALTGIEVRTRKDMDEAARLLRARGVKTVVITLGARGAFVCAEGIAAIVSGFKVEPVDTTAAGDVFSGALAVALAEGRPLTAAARFANAAAALSVTRLGAQPSAPVRRDIDRLLTERAR